MRRITTWLAITLAVVGFAVYYQVGLASDGHEPARAASTECSGDATERAASTPAPGGAEAETTTEEDKADDPCAQSEHSGKPGENKD